MWKSNANVGWMFFRNSTIPDLESQDPILGSRRFIQISTHCPCNFPSSPNSDSHSHSHSHSLSSNTDDVSPTYDHFKQFCPKIILMTLTIRSLAILPSCSDGGSLFLERTMTRVVFIAQNSINGKILPNPRRFPLCPKLNILSKHFFIFYFSPFTAFSCVFYCADVRNMA